MKVDVCVGVCVCVCVCVCVVVCDFFLSLSVFCQYITVAFLGFEMKASSIEEMVAKL